MAPRLVALATPDTVVKPAYTCDTATYLPYALKRAGTPCAKPRLRPAAEDFAVKLRRRMRTPGSDHCARDGGAHHDGDHAATAAARARPHVGGKPGATARPTGPGPHAARRGGGGQ
jgi:hypothetical protein